MPVRYLFEDRVGQCFARNTGIASANGEIILFTDDDVRFPHDWIEQMCRPIFDCKSHAVAGSVKMAPHLVRPWMCPLHRAWLLDYNFSQEPRPHVMIGANMAFSVQVLKHVPEFDVELGPGALGFSDDVLFSWQVESAGFPIFGVSSEVEHHFRADRLLRSALLKRAEQEGHVAAYLSYHWLHSNMRFSKARELKHLAELKYYRLLRTSPSVSPRDEGCAEWELELIKDIHFHRQYAIERTGSRKYARCGLRKTQSSPTETLNFIETPNEPDPSASEPLMSEAQT
jgi:glycosyltransferase involved in cell wall biosynthesis